MITSFYQWLIATDFPTCYFYERSLLHNYLMLIHLSRVHFKIVTWQYLDISYPEVEAIAFIELMKQSILSVLGERYQQAI
ncbi:hypothetical protein [Nostoc commune]|uniref:hypothetical protein n=1 Tax=Nostoc commune TaxID=1178 RepID=UPI0011B21CE5|nr:hypothetical protein [Nostoc commune]